MLSRQGRVMYLYKQLFISGNTRASLTESRHFFLAGKMLAVFASVLETVISLVSWTQDGFSDL